MVVLQSHSCLWFPVHHPLEWHCLSAMNQRWRLSGQCHAHPFLHLPMLPTIDHCSTKGKFTLYLQQDTMYDLGFNSVRFPPDCPYPKNGSRILLTASAKNNSLTIQTRYRDTKIKWFLLTTLKSDHSLYTPESTSLMENPDFTAILLDEPSGRFTQQYLGDLSLSGTNAGNLEVSDLKGKRKWFITKSRLAVDDMEPCDSRLGCLDNLSGSSSWQGNGQSRLPQHRQGMSAPSAQGRHPAPADAAASQPFPTSKGKVAQLPVPRGHPQSHSQGKALSTLMSLQMSPAFLQISMVKGLTGKAKCKYDKESTDIAVFCEHVQIS
ncbi:hypothetical protein Nmel_007393 [Mimus melanotis]